MRSFIALVLSFPALVTSYQMLMLCDLRDLLAGRQSWKGREQSSR